jgi:predicted Zn-dependent protease
MFATPWRAAEGADSLNFIRDAEIENTIRVLATPVFRAAGLEPASVRIFLIRDRQLNAFVAGGQNLFLNTGLLIKTENASQLLGVVAHETGHIAGGHLSRMYDNLEKAGTQSILGMIAGIAAAAVTGQGAAAAVISQGANQLAIGNLLRFSQTQEYAADMAAVKFLEQSGESAQGIYDFMKVLGDQEALYTSNQDAYVRTHPLTRDRMDNLENALAKTRYRNAEIAPELEAAHQRMRAKLIGYLESPQIVFKEYPETDKSANARYAQAIAWYRRPDLPKALPLVDSLIAEKPDDPFYYELKGQILYENGRLKESLPAYETAVRLLPTSPLLRIGLAQTQIGLNGDGVDPTLLDPAITNLRAALVAEPRVSSVWRLLATAYGRKGDVAMSSLALAEEAMLQNNRRDARFYAERASRTLPAGSIYKIQAEDIIRAADQRKDNDRR